MMCPEKGVPERVSERVVEGLSRERPSVRKGIPFSTKARGCQAAARIPSTTSRSRSSSTSCSTTQKIRDVIDTITSKAVLILGRFTPERKAVLDALREELRKRDYLPILFDFEKPASKDLTGTVRPWPTWRGSSSPT